MKILITIIAGTFLSFIAVSYSVAQSPSVIRHLHQYVITKDVDVNEFKELIDENKGTILDVRTKDEITSGIIKGAIHIDYYSSDFKEQLEQLDKNKPVYVYCASGGRSSGAMNKMKGMGFTTIYNLEGGMGAWKASGFPVE